MSKKFSLKVAIRTIVLFAVISCLYYFIVYSVKRNWCGPQIVKTQKPLCPKLKSHTSNDVTYRDLSEEFEAQMGAFRLSADVFEALKRDGYIPTALSNDISPRKSQKQVENTSLGSLNSAFSSASKYSANAEGEASKKNSVALLVPNVVHYVHFGTDLTFTFINYLSYRSVERFIQPEQIFVHGDTIPRGQWWNLTINTVKNIYHVQRSYSWIAPNGKAFKYAAHISDYLRTEILLRYGGIYLDADVLVVKPFTPLRQYSVTLGRESDLGICNGIILAEKGAPFLRLLLEQYRSYKGLQEIWAEKSVINAHLLAGLYPHLVHVEETSLNQPNYRYRALIYDGWYNWTNNYSVHLWIRLWPVPKRPNGVEDILKPNTTFAQVARLIIFGFPDSLAVVAA